MNEIKYAKLRGRMAEKGITQNAIADCLGISVVAVNKKLKGIIGFSQKDIIKICDLLDISSEEIGLFFYT